MTPSSAVSAAAGRLGILGGMFDPIHLGHLAAAEAAERALSLNRMLLIPSHIPPHRAQPATAGAEDRLAMAQLVVNNRPGWSVSRLEIDRQGTSYTYDTLVELGGPASDKFFITGADAFAEIATWSRYPAVLDLANFVVVSRPGTTLDSLRERVPSAFSRQPATSTRVILVAADTPDVSSTEIRRRVRAGQSLSGLVPDAVAGYIAAHGLYRGDPHAPMAQN
jgi:nicotinate-nucleotide adenylyltransferase